MKVKIRKILSYEEEVFIEGNKQNEKVLRLYTAIAVIENPWCKKGFVDNLNNEINNFAPVLGNELTQRILYLAKGKENIEAYGKAAMCGLDGEIEHASALIHTLRFGNIFRKALSAETYLSFTNTRSSANSPINIPLMHIHDTGKRSHYHTIQISINDAPKNNEIIIALGAANGGRPHHRIGDRYKDLEDLKQ